MSLCVLLLLDVLCDRPFADLASREAKRVRESLRQKPTLYVRVSAEHSQVSRSSRAMKLGGAVRT